LSRYLRSETADDAALAYEATFFLSTGKVGAPSSRADVSVSDYHWEDGDVLEIEVIATSSRPLRGHFSFTVFSERSGRWEIKGHRVTPLDRTFPKDLDGVSDLVPVLRGPENCHVEFVRCDSGDDWRRE